jgi:hypothetical protein
MLMALVCIGLSNLAANAQAPFWSETFANSIPAGWSANEVAGNGNATSNWVWTNTGPAGSFSTGALTSTTAADGWMLFDSDLNCSGEQDVWLVSPQLDLSGKDQVFLQFESRYRRYNDLTWIEVSTDSVTWTAIPVFEGAENNDYGDLSSNGAVNPHKVTVNLTPFGANASTFWFAFHFLADQTTVQGGSDIGCGYSWQVDDVALIDYDPTPAYNMSIGQFFYTPASFAQPASQITTDTMSFFAEVSNVGNATVTNIVLKAQILDNAGNEIFADSTLIPSLEAGVVDTLIQTDGFFAPGNQLPVGDYELAYSIYSLDNDDGDLSNNQSSAPFVVTDNLWSKEAAPTIAYRPGGGGDYQVGNLYNTSYNWVDSYMATTASFSAAKNAANGNLLNNLVKIILLEVDETVVDPGWGNFDSNLDFISNPAFILRSINDHNFTSAANFNTQTTQLVDFDTELPGVLLKPGNRYLLVASYEGEYNVIFHSYSEAIPQANFFKISTVIWSSTDGTWYLGGFGPEPAAQLRMSIDLANTTDERALPEESLTFFPNPASDKLNVRLSLDEPTLANVTLADLNGRVILIDEIQQAHQNSLEYNVSNLPAGTYLVRVATKEGTKTKKFVVVR